MKNKIIVKLLPIVLLLVLWGCHTNNMATNTKPFVEELQKSTKEYVLLDFSADWCPDCVHMSMLFETDEIKSIVEEKFIYHKYDVGMFNRYNSLRKAYNIKAVTTLVFINRDGKVIENQRFEPVTKHYLESPANSVIEFRDYLLSIGN